MTFFDGEGLSRTIREVVAAGPVDMAVAFWGTDAVSRLALPADLSTYQVVCDAESGSCSPIALGMLLDRGAKVATLSGMHAKLYRASNQMVVASANASVNGLSEEGDGDGLEVGMLVSEQEAINRAAAWFARTFKRARILHSRDLSAIANRWSARRRSRPLRETLAEALMSNAPSLGDRALKVYIYEAASPSTETETYFKASPAYDPDTWERDGWPIFWGEGAGLSAEDELVCFVVSRGKIREDGVWRVNEMLPNGPEPIWPAKKLEQVLSTSIGDMRPFVAVLQQALTEGRLNVNGPPVSIIEFAGNIRMAD